MRKQKKISRFLKVHAWRHLQKWQKAFFRQLRPLGQKGKTMKKFMRTFDPSSGEQSLVSRFATGFTAVLVALTLAACGGGGGGSSGTSPTPVDPPASSPNPPSPPASNPNPPSPPASNPNPPSPPASDPPPAPVPSGKLSVEPSPDCEIATAGVGTCQRTLVASDMKDVSGQVAIIGPKGESLPARNGESVPVEAPLGNSTYKLTDGKAVLATVTVKVTCDAKLEAKDGKCVKPVVKLTYYDRVNLVLSGEVFPDTGNGTLGVAYPQIIVGKTLILPKNKTGIQIGLCAFSMQLLGKESGEYEGLPAVSCSQVDYGNIWAVFPLDPVKREILPKIAEYDKDFKLPAPFAYLTFEGAPYGEFGASPYAKYGVNNYGMFIDVPGVGIYYFTGDDHALRLTTDVFKTNEIIQDTGQTYGILMTYSHPAP